MAPSTFLEDWLKRAGVSWSSLILVVGLSLILILVEAAYLDGVLSRPFDSNFWRFHLLGPVMMMYLLLIQPVLRRWEDEAIQAFRPMLSLNDSDLQHLVNTAYPLNRFHEGVAAGLGVLFSLLLDQPWNDQLSWVKLNMLLNLTLGFALVGWLVYTSLAGTKLLATLHRQPLKLDIFNPNSVEPIAHWSLGITMSLVGIITLSILFFPGPLLWRPEPIIVLGILTLLSVLIFFINLRDTHQIMIEAKKQASQKVRHNLWTGYREIEDWTATGSGSTLAEPSETVKSVGTWVAYEKRIMEAPEWPYSADIIRRLIVTFLLPTTIWIMRAAIVRLLTSG